ncbi:MAG: hypothetical protein ACXAEB_12825 [Candidatus Thorarchaeota archaeon]
MDIIHYLVRVAQDYLLRIATMTIAINATIPIPASRRGSTADVTAGAWLSSRPIDGS